MTILRAVPDVTPVRLDGPVEADRKPVVVISPATDGLKTWLTSRGDDLAAGPSGRGKGTPIRVKFDGTETFPSTKSVEFQFDQPIELHDGQLNWTQGAFTDDDEFSFSVILPSTQASESAGTGNVNAVDLGGGLISYVPAAGDGSHTVDLAQAVPVPVPKGSSGYWHCDNLTGDITATPDGSGKFALFNASFQPFLISNVVMGNNFGLFDVDVYKTDWLHQRWKCNFSVTKTTSGAGSVSGWLLLFRPSNQRA